MKYSLIVAIGQNNVIGKDNALLWHLPADLKYFREKTTGHHIIMGRKTFESIGGGKPLPHRTSIILTSTQNYEAPGCIVAHTVEEALARTSGDSEVFFIGGQQVYEHSLAIVGTMYITRIHASFEGDVFFPLFDMSGWELSTSYFRAKDEKNAHDMTFEVYTRKTS